MSNNFLWLLIGYYCYSTTTNILIQPTVGDPCIIILRLRKTRKQGKHASAVFLSKLYLREALWRQIGGDVQVCGGITVILDSVTKDSRQVRIKWTLFYLDNIILFPFLFFHDSQAYVYWNKASYHLSRRSRFWCRELSFVFSLEYFFFLCFIWLEPFHRVDISWGTPPRIVYSVGAMLFYER